MPNGGYVKENGITLCDKCHLKAEIELNDRQMFKGYSSEELYRRINSSFELALRESEKL
jgi:hypothetical protein